LLRTRFDRNRSLLLVTLAALALRLWWNLSVHRPTDFAYSDMGAYLERGNLMVDKPGLQASSLALYPPGTHLFIGALRYLFGRTNDAALGAGFAVLGSLAVAYTYATAERFLTRPWARHVTGAVLVVYYPWISLGGYTLSEIPFALGVAAAAFYGLRLADEGRRGDAWLLGLSIGLGALVRPQILVLVPLLGLHFLLRRRAWRRFTRGLGWRAAAPLVVLLSLAAWRLHHHTGHWGLISSNGPLNFVFGRCHNIGLNAVTPHARGFFGPPSLGTLLYHQKEAAHGRELEPIVSLDPVLGEQLTIHAEMGDAEANYELARRCVQKSGYKTQLRFAVTHVVLLWGYNIIWPDQGSRGAPPLRWLRRILPSWGTAMFVSCNAYNAAFLVPSALGLLLAFRRRRARSMLLACHGWSLVITSMLYFGDTRYRAPYDGLLIVLAMAIYIEAGGLLLRALERVRARLARP
jgi:4-amino-4-deoxy-L-arabinose transferase-like glycosyltransferase